MPKIKKCSRVDFSWDYLVWAKDRGFDGIEIFRETVRVFFEFPERVEIGEVRMIE